MKILWGAIPSLLHPLNTVRALSGRRGRSVYRMSATGQPVGTSKGGVMRGTRRTRCTIVMCGATCVLLASLASACPPASKKTFGRGRPDAPCEDNFRDQERGQACSE